MDIEQVKSKIKNIFNKTVEVSKNTFEKAGDAVQDFSDKTMIRIEKNQLDGKLNDAFAEFGIVIFNSLSEKLTSEEMNSVLETFVEGESLENAKQIIEKIQSYKKEIASKEELLKKEKNEDN